MSGSDFGSFILGLIVVAIVVAIGVWLLHWLYLRSSKERAFVRTGLGGQKVVLNGGAFASGNSILGNSSTTGSYGSVTVSGTGSTWNNYGQLKVGKAGDGYVEIGRAHV